MLVEADLRGREKMVFCGLTPTRCQNLLGLPGNGPTPDTVKYFSANLSPVGVTRDIS